MKVELLTYTKLNNVKRAFPDLEQKELLQHLSYTFAIEKISRASDISP